MTETINALKNILMPLFEIQTDAWFNPEPEPKPSCQASEIFQHLSERWEPIMDFEEIGHLFKPSKLRLDFSKRVLYLPPLEKKFDFVPILSLSCILDKNQSSAQFKVMLVCLDEHKKLCGIGFRMETPENMNQNVDTSSNEGIHDFYHAQLIRKFDQRAPDSIQGFDCPSWLPQSQPSFPLPADCPVSLLLCLIVTLYGKKYYKNFLNTHGTPKTEQYQDKLDLWVNPERLQEKRHEKIQKQLNRWEKRKQSKRIRK